MESMMRCILLWVLLLIAMVFSGCTIPTVTSEVDDQTSQALKSTITIMEFQATDLSNQVAQDAQKIQAQATLLAQQQALIATQKTSLSEQNPQPSDHGQTPIAITELPNKPVTPTVTDMAALTHDTNLEISGQDIAV
jgi:hypothetical protein